MTGTPFPAPPAAEHAVLVWVAEGTWPACVDAARDLAPPQASFVLLHVIPQDVPGAAHGAFAGLLGRGRPDLDPGTAVEALSADAAGTLLDAAERRLGRTCTRTVRRGRAEREVVAAAAGARLLVLARDGDRSRLGPRSLGREARFVVDHAPCPVLLVWPEATPALGTLPRHPPGPPPGSQPHPPGPPPHPGHPRRHRPPPGRGPRG